MMLIIRILNMCTCLCLFAISDSIHEGTIIRDLQCAAAKQIAACALEASPTACHRALAQIIHS
jgi:hypothetical protein